MPNKVTGATDYLTVAGSAGSETFQCPNTAPYQTADTDRLWFLPSTTQLNVTTANLVAYDFTRTIIKYDDASPYTIRAIMILSSDISASQLNKLHTDFKLPIFWSGSENDYGFLKGNRGGDRSLWNLPGTITNTLNFWYTGKVIESFTLTETSIDLMEDISGNGNHLAKIADDTTRPTYNSSTAIITLVRANSQRLRKATAVINQPHTIFVVYKKLINADIAGYLIGSATNAAGLIGTGTSGTGVFVMHAGTALNYGASDITTTHIHVCEYNGENSKYWLDSNDTPVMGNAGTSNMNGIEFGAYNNGAVFIDAEFCEAISYNGVLSDADRYLIRDYLKTKWGL